MATVVSVSGKGGAGKTTSVALLLDELALAQYPGRILAIDADPAMTLHLALGFQAPAATLATVRDSLAGLENRQVQNLPGGVGQYVIEQLQQQQALSRRQVRTLPVDMLSMGGGEGQPGCYCRINNTLSLVVEKLVGNYDLVLVDNEAGMEHLSRHRIKHVDYFVTVTGDSQASQVVGQRLLQVALDVGLEIGELVYIHVLSSPHSMPPRDIEGGLAYMLITVPYSDMARRLAEIAPVVVLDSEHPMRTALRPLVERLMNEYGG